MYLFFIDRLSHSNMSFGKSQKLNFPMHWSHFHNVVDNLYFSYVFFFSPEGSNSNIKFYFHFTLMLNKLFPACTLLVFLACLSCLFLTPFLTMPPASHRSEILITAQNSLGTMSVECYRWGMCEAELMVDMDVFPLYFLFCFFLLPVTSYLSL